MGSLCCEFVLPQTKLECSSSITIGIRYRHRDPFFKPLIVVELLHWSFPKHVLIVPGGDVRAERALRVYPIGYLHQSM